MKQVLKIIFVFLLFVFLPCLTHAASMSISPASGTYEVGDKVTVKVKVSSGASINAISGIISFSTSVFKIESVSKSGSILNFWVTEPSFSQSAGTFQFEGVALNGFQGSGGTVITAVLQATKVGSGTVSFTSGQVLANDGQGTDVTGSLTGATFSIKEKTEKAPPPAETPPASPPPVVKSPEISLTQKFGEWAILGISNYPHDQVLLTFTAETGIRVLVDGTTDANGEFTILVPQILKGGVYKVSATITDSGRGYNSNEIIISFGNIFSDLGPWMKFAIIAMIIIILLLIILVYLYLQRNKKRKREIKEAEDMVRESFRVLKEGAEAGAKKDIGNIENMIAKEIKDVEDI
jgi:hypothetical protein